MSRDVHTALRAVFVLGLAAVAGLAYHRFRTTPEQEDLTHFVSNELPPLLEQDRAIQDALGQLLASPSTRPAEARRVIVDELMPRIARLKKAAAELQPQTAEVAELKRAYLGVTDRLAEACRAIVRIIDDPKISGPEGWRRVREEIAAVQRSYREWDERIARVLSDHNLKAVRPSLPSRP